MAFRGQVDFLEPINLAEHLDKVELYLGQVCQMAGISKMQLDYWTNKAQIPTKGRKQRIYDMDAVETVMLIKQAKDKGLNLGAAIDAARRFREQNSGLTETSCLARRGVEQRADVAQQHAQRNVALAAEHRAAEVAGEELLDRLDERAASSSRSGNGWNSGRIAIAIGRNLRRSSDRSVALTSLRIRTAFAGVLLACPCSVALDQGRDQVDRRREDDRRRVRRADLEQRLQVAELDRDRLRLPSPPRRRAAAPRPGTRPPR